MKSRSRVTRREFRVLVATDGSLPAQGALRTALVFPWPRGTRVLGDGLPATFASRQTEARAGRVGAEP